MSYVENRSIILAGVLVILSVTACPSPVKSESQTVEYAINIKNAAHGTVSADRKTAKAGEVITLTVLPETGYETASIFVTGAGDIALHGSGNHRTFTMPADHVSVAASFTAIATGPVKYRIRMGTMTDGSFNSIPDGSQYKDGPVTLIARPDTGKKYRPGSLTVLGMNRREAVILTQEEDDEWTFTMPAEDVEVHAAFIDEAVVLYGITITQPDNGIIECAQTIAVAGDPITITLTVDDTDDYRYQKDSLRITGADGDTVDFEPMGELQWTFTMPEEDVAIDAVIEFIPWFGITAAEGSENGSFSITGVATTGPYEGKAREGTPITITAIPAPGYKLTDGGLSATPAGAVAFTRVEGQPSWTFDMADTDLEIGVAFAELGLLDIYQGGARKGITIGELSDDDEKKYYADSVDMEAEEPGRNHNQRVIKITSAVNEKGNAVQQSFALFSDTEIDLETVAALSFWAKANKSLNIRFVGFGDADPNKRVVYTGENYNQAIPVGTEWKRYIVPVPAAHNGHRTARVFFFNATVAKGNYVCIDDIEFVESGAALTEITMTGANSRIFYGTTDAAKILKGAPLKLAYTCDDGTVVTLQNASNSHTLKYNLAPWLIPFIGVGGNVIFSDGVITPREKGQSSAISLSVNIPGARGNSITAHITDGLLLDDFEDMEGTGSISIPGTPAEGTGYVWHTSGGAPVVVGREYFTVEHKEIHSGLRAGSWRPPAASANKTRGGRNFDAKDASGCQTLVFRIKVTVGGGNTVPQRNTVFTFELRNGGRLDKKAEGAFFARQFTYDTDNPDGWQEVAMPLADFVDLGLDPAAITGYAFGVVDNRASALRIMLDDIALY